MENATKALIIAGGILIGILILSIGVLLINNAQTLSRSYDEKLQTDAINGFNNKFMQFATEINAQQMVSLINMIYENNRTNYADRKITINVSGDHELRFVTGNEIVADDDTFKIMNEGRTYECTQVKYYSSGYIKSMLFRKK